MTLGPPTGVYMVQMEPMVPEPMVPLPSPIITYWPAPLTEMDMRRILREVITELDAEKRAEKRRRKAARKVSP